MKGYRFPMDFLDPVFLLAALLALTIHECAHAYAAYKLGDHTAKVSGRLTLNPIAHLDPLGTLMFFAVGFGWGKPVPVNPYYFKHPTRDNALTAFAGPLSNLLLAFVAYLIMAAGVRYTNMIGDPFSYLGDADAPRNALDVLARFLEATVFVNVGLCAFNLLPVAPLDGSKVLQAFIPPHYEDEYERFMSYGPYILLGLIVLGRMGSFDPLTLWIWTIMGWVFHAFTAIGGIFGF